MTKTTSKDALTRDMFLANLVLQHGERITKRQVIRELVKLKTHTGGFSQAARVLGVHPEIFRSAIVANLIYPKLLAALRLQENERTYRVAKTSKVR